MPVFLLEHTGSKNHKRMTVDGERIVIGRSPSADISLADSGVSKQHVVVEKKAEGYVFRDLGSSNGTLHNHKKSPGGHLAHGDELQVGRICITVLLDPTSDEKPETRSSNEPPGAGAEEPIQDSTSATPDANTKIVTEGRPDTKRSVLRKPVRRRKTSPVLAIVIGTLLIGSVGGTAIGIFLGKNRSSNSEKQHPTLAKPPTPNTQFTDHRTTPNRSPVQPDTLTPAVENAIERTRGFEILDRKIPVFARRENGRYADRTESERTLYRLYLDVLRRPPTRQEEKKTLPLSHVERWQRIVSAPPEPPSFLGDLDATFKIFLNREPTIDERDGLAEWSPEDLRWLGTVLTATHEYRSTSHSRKRDFRQLAMSLFVDLRNEENPQPDDLTLVEKALAVSDAALPTTARVLAASSRLTDPRKEPDYKPEHLIAWIQTETRRFRQRPLKSNQLVRLLDRLTDPEVDLRWYRQTLASSDEYRRY